MPTIYNELTGAGPFTICTVPTDKIYRLVSVVAQGTDATGEKLTLKLYDVVKSGVEEERCIIDTQTNVVRGLHQGAVLFVGTVKLYIVGGSNTCATNITLTFKEVQA